MINNLNNKMTFSLSLFIPLESSSSILLATNKIILLIAIKVSILPAIASPLSAIWPDLEIFEIWDKSVAKSSADLPVFLAFNST